MEIHFFAKTDLGRIRTSNEDFFLSEKIDRDEYLFVVADGMGGHQAGDVAARLATEAFFRDYRKSRGRGEKVCKAMENAVKLANDYVYQRAVADVDKRGMGTTFSALLICGQRACGVHIGDSRIYLIRDGILKQLTKDHSFVEKLVEDGVITNQEAKSHPQKNVLYLSLGSRENVTPQVLDDIEVFPGDTFILCSDGLSNLVSENEMIDLVRDVFPEEAAGRMIDMANDRGGTDNITVQVIKTVNSLAESDTRPDRIVGGRPRMVTFVSLAGVFLMLIFLFWLFFGIIERKPEVLVEQSVIIAEKELLPPTQAGWRIEEVDISHLQAAGSELEDFHYLAAENVFLVRDGVLSLFNLADGSMPRQGELLDGLLVPADREGVFTLKKNSFAAGQIVLLRHGEKEPLLSSAKLPETDRQYFSQEIEALFIAEDSLIFHDGISFFIASGLFGQKAPIIRLVGGITPADDTRFFFNRTGEDLWMTVLEEEYNRLKFFRVPEIVLDSVLEIDLNPDLLAVEYLSSGVIMYYRRYFQEWKNGLSSEMNYPGEPMIAVNKILMDTISGDRFLLAEDRSLFKLVREND